MSRGTNVFRRALAIPATNDQTVARDSNDVLLYALFARIAMANNDVVEFETKYDKTLNQIELDVPDESLAIFDQITGMQRGERFKQFINWLIGSSSIVAAASVDQDPNFIDAGSLLVWTGATNGSLGLNKLVLLLPADELSVVGYNFKVASLGGDLKVSLVWVYDSGLNNSFNINTTCNVSEIGSSSSTTTSEIVSISTVNLIKGDIRESEIINVSGLAQNDIVSLTFRRNYSGSADPTTDLIGVVGLKIEFV